jgi:hypothetical protein
MFTLIQSRLWLVPALLLTSAGLTSDARAEPPLSGWSTPVNIGAPINTAFRETGPRLSADGRSLYFSSDRPCGADDAVLDFNLWVARRNSWFSRWQEPRCLSINANPRIVGEAPTPYQDREPELSRDQHWLYFVSDRPGSVGPPVPVGGDIWVSWRHDTRNDNGWTEPFRLVGLNTEAGERTPQYFGGIHGGLPQLFFATTRADGGDIWVVKILGGAVIGEARPVAELNTPDLIDAGGAMNRNGRETFIFRGANGPGLDIYTATRPHLHAAWSTPVKVDAVNSSAADQEVTLSASGSLLFLTSNRSGSTLSADGVSPSLDIWVARRWPTFRSDKHEEYEEEGSDDR